MAWTYSQKGRIAGIPGVSNQKLFEMAEESKPRGGPQTNETSVEKKGPEYR
jgi:hypothetical protein